MSDNKPRIQDIDPNSPLKGEPIIIYCYNGNYKEQYLKEVDIYISSGKKLLIFIGGIFIGISLTLYFK
jgi:hypothetical protein